MNRLYEYSVSGEMYSVQCDSYGVVSGYWNKDQTYKKELDSIYDSRSEPKEFLTPFAPFKVKQIYYLSDPRAMEGSSLIAFALSEDGILWHWEHGFGIYPGLFLYLILVIEIFVYALGSILFVVIRQIISASRNQAMKKHSGA